MAKKTHTQSQAAHTAQPGTDQGEHHRFDTPNDPPLEDPGPESSDLGDLIDRELADGEKLQEGKIPDGLKSEDILEPSPFSAWGPNGQMWFEGALSAMREGNKVRRRCWPAGVFAVIMPALELPPYNTQELGPKVNDRTAKFIGKDTPLNSHPYFACYIPHVQVWQPGWIPNVYDIMGEDWEVMEKEADA